MCIRDSRLIIDPVAAVVVQWMFRWASEGAGLNTIAVRLNEAGVLTPSHYKKTVSYTHLDVYKRQAFPELQSASGRGASCKYAGQ